MFHGSRSCLVFLNGVDIIGSEDLRGHFDFISIFNRLCFRLYALDLLYLAVDWTRLFDQSAAL